MLQKRESWRGQAILLMLSELVVLVLESEAFAQDSEKHFNYFEHHPEKAPIQKTSFGDFDPLLGPLTAEVTPKYQAWGQNLSQDILSYRQTFNLGDSNFAGMHFQYPMGFINLKVHRNLAPDLFDTTRWLVEDTLSIEVDAQTFLKSLKESGQITITDKNLAAFAGVTYLRTYRYMHFAPTYLDGLSSDFTKLFLSFTYMNMNKLADMGYEEYIEREDFLSVQVSAFGNYVYAPSFYGLAGKFKVNAGYYRMKKVMVQSLFSPLKIGPSDQLLKINYESSKSIWAAGEVSLLADFYGILQLTLLSIDFKYEQTNGKKIVIELLNKDNEILKNENFFNERKELQDMLSMRLPQDDVTYLKNYVTTNEDKQKDTKTYNYLLFLIGGIKSREVEYVSVQKGNESRTFLRHTSEQTQYVQNIWIKLINSILVISKIIPIKMDSIEASRTKKMQLEFEQTMPARIVVSGTQAKKPLFVEDGKLSLTFTHELSIKNLSNPAYSFLKTEALDFLTAYTLLDRNIAKGIKTGDISKAASFSTRVTITPKGIRYFHNIDTLILRMNFQILCNVPPGKENACTKNLENKYQDHWQDYLTYQKVNLWKFKAFLEAVYTEAEDKNVYANFFGTENTFIDGHFDAQTKDNQPFATSFTEGTLQSWGVVDQYERQ